MGRYKRNILQCAEKNRPMIQKDQWRLLNWCSEIATLNSTLTFAAVLYPDSSTSKTYKETPNKTKNNFDVYRNKKLKVFSSASFLPKNF